MHRRLTAAAVAVLAVAVLSSAGLERNAPAGALACSVPLTLPPAPSNRPKLCPEHPRRPGPQGGVGHARRLVRAHGSNRPPRLSALAELAFLRKARARLTVGAVTAGGRALTTTRPDATTLVVNRALAAGERVTVSMPWKLRLPRGDGFQLKGGGSARLVMFFPILAWDGQGWALDPAVRKLDSMWPTSPTADFEVRIATPRGLQVLATGREVRPGLWRAQSVRDFGLAVGSFTVKRTTVRAPKPVSVVVGLERGSGYPIGAFVSETTRALRRFAQRYGGYPWPTYTLAVMGDFPVVNGLASPTIGFIGDTSLVLVPHETAHQWFYALAGNNQSRDPWLSEGTATWAQAGLEGSLAAMRGMSIPGNIRNRIGAPMSFWDSFSFEQLRLGVYTQTVQALAELGDSATVDCALRQFVVRTRTARPRHAIC